MSLDREVDRIGIQFIRGPWMSGQVIWTLLYRKWEITECWGTITNKTILSTTRIIVSGDMYWFQMEAQ